MQMENHNNLYFHITSCIFLIVFERSDRKGEARTAVGEVRISLNIEEGRKRQSHKKLLLTLWKNKFHATLSPLRMY